MKRSLDKLSFRYLMSLIADQVAGRLHARLHQLPFQLDNSSAVPRYSCDPFGQNS